MKLISFYLLLLTPIVYLVFFAGVLLGPIWTAFYYGLGYITTRIQTKYMADVNAELQKIMKEETNA